MTDIFNENSLRAEIVKIWGEHGAHIEVFDHILDLAMREGISTESEDDVNLSMEFSTYIRKPFAVEALEITRENIHELSELIGEYGEDENGPYIIADPEKVPTVHRVVPGYWVTKMGRNVRCYSERVFKDSFTPNTPSLDRLMKKVGEDERPAVAGRYANG